MEKVPAYAGTINTMLLVNRPLTPAALARGVVTMTEGKSAALQRLAVPSGCTSIWRPARAPISTASRRPSEGRRAHVGQPAHEARRADRPGGAGSATLEALRWQNGLEASYTRGVFHALGRYGVREATVFDDIAPFLRRRASSCCGRTARRRSTSRWSAPRRTRSPRCAIACATARCRRRSAADAMVQQAAALAANLAAQVHRWPEFRVAAAAARGRRREGAGLAGGCARLVREMAHRVSASLTLLRPEPLGCCWRRRRRSDRSAIRSTRGIPSG